MPPVFKPGLSDTIAHALYPSKPLALGWDKRKVLVGVSVNVGLFVWGHLLTLSLCLLGNEYPRAHQLQEECHVLGRGGEALPQGPGDCPLQ